MKLITTPLPKPHLIEFADVPCGTFFEYTQHNGPSLTVAIKVSPDNWMIWVDGAFGTSHWRDFHGQSFGRAITRLFTELELR